MFTGIIESIGKVQRIENLGEDSRLVITAEPAVIASLKSGDSIAINGVCLTVTAFDKETFITDASAETLSVTSLGHLENGSHVNLERAMLLSDRMHGHIVSGHVDATGTVIERVADGRSVRFSIEIPSSLQRYVCKKGSVCIDGVSLTVNEKDHNRFSINVIPHTLEKTIIIDYHEGTVVNIEVDMIARYLESLYTPA